MVTPRAQQAAIDVLYGVLSIFALGLLVTLLLIGFGAHGVLWLLAVFAIYTALALLAALGLWAWERAGKASDHEPY